MWLPNVDSYHVILLSTSGPISFKVLSKHYLSDVVYVSDGMPGTRAVNVELLNTVLRKLDFRVGKEIWSCH